MIPRNISQGLRLLANGVYVVAAAADGKAHGFTATWVCQASFRNPLLTVAIDKGHDTYQVIKRSGGAVVNILRSDQKDVAEFFGRQQTEPQSPYFRRDGGQETPVLNDSLATISCRVIGEMDARDHVVLLLEATEAQLLGDATPLIYWSGKGYAAATPMGVRSSQETNREGE
jgi:flavin reductase (DIM6/NTAB) family NADH-FMN oxidoreductase RutF